MSAYPGVSKHLDDSHDNVNNDFYYTEWDDSIYEEYKDYEDISDDNSHVVNSEVQKTLDNTASERKTEVNNNNSNNKRRKKDEILLDLRFRPERPARKRPPTVKNYIASIFRLLDVFQIFTFQSMILDSRSNLAQRQRGATNLPACFRTAGFY